MKQTNKEQQSTTHIISNYSYFVYSGKTVI